MSFPKSDEDVLVELDYNNLFAVAEYYEREWVPSQSTNPIEGEESYVLSGNVLSWYAIPKNIKLNKIKDVYNIEEVLVKLKSKLFAVANCKNGVWTPGNGTHPSYLDIYPVLDSDVIGWISIEEFLKIAKKEEILY